MADRKLFSGNPMVTSPETTKRIAIGDDSTTVQNMTLSSLKTFLEVPVVTPTTILTKSVDIGTWNMDSAGSKNVSLGVALSKVRGVSPIIKSDSGEMFPLVYPHSNEEISGYFKICNTPTSNALAVLSRKANYFFDQSGFNDGTINRGYLIVNYVC